MIATRLVLERTLAAFASGGAPPATAEDGRDVLEVIAAGYRSANSGRRISLTAGADRHEVRVLRMGTPPQALRALSVSPTPPAVV